MSEQQNYMPSVHKRYHALKLCDIAVDLIRQSQIKLAIETLEESIAACPTAEAYTHRGWARSCLGRFDLAINDCKQAIRLDSDYGNPYNDIGVYLMQKGFLDEAIHWLNRAKVAPRYIPRHFPYLNIGHIYMMRDEQNFALIEYVQALEFDPGNEAALEAIADMDMNF